MTTSDRTPQSHLIDRPYNLHPSIVPTNSTNQRSPLKKSIKSDRPHNATD